jgi:hypothetical protein
MANPLRFQQFSVTAAAGQEELVLALSSVSGIKQTVKSVWTVGTANIDLLVYQGQTKAVDMPSSVIPTTDNRIEIDIDVDAATQVQVGIRNNTAGNVTQVITVEYDYGT